MVLPGIDQTFECFGNLSGGQKVTVAGSGEIPAQKKVGRELDDYPAFLSQATEGSLSDRFESTEKDNNSAHHAK